MTNSKTIFADSRGCINGVLAKLIGKGVNSVKEFPAKSSRWLWEYEKKYWSEVIESRGLRLIIKDRIQGQKKTILSYYSNPIATKFDTTTELTVPLTTVIEGGLFIGIGSAVNSFSEDQLDKSVDPIIKITPGAKNIIRLVSFPLYDTFEIKIQISDHYTDFYSWLSGSNKELPRINEFEKLNLITGQQKKQLNKIALIAAKQVLGSRDDYLKLEKETFQFIQNNCKQGSMTSTLQTCKDKHLQLQLSEKWLNTFDLDQRLVDQMKNAINIDATLKLLPYTIKQMLTTAHWPLIDFDGHSDLKIDKLLILDTDVDDEYTQSKLERMSQSLLSQSKKIEGNHDKLQKQLEDFLAYADETAEIRDNQLLKLVKEESPDLKMRRIKNIYNYLSNNEINFHEANYLVYQTLENPDVINSKIEAGNKMFPAGRLSTLNRPDLPFTNEEIEFSFHGTDKEYKFENELDYWRITLKDPRFSDLKKLWLSRMINDGALLSKSMARLKSYRDFARIQNKIESNTLEHSDIATFFNFKNPSNANSFVSGSQEQIKKLVSKYNPSNESIKKCLVDVSRFWYQVLKAENRKLTNMELNSADFLKERKTISKQTELKHQNSLSACKVSIITK